MIRQFSTFLLDAFRQRDMLGRLSVREFHERYLGSYLGLAWAFIQPLITIAVLYTVFTLGFRSLPVSGDVPFFLWLTCGLVPWFFIAEGLAAGTNAILAKDFMIKNVSFRASLLPLSSILASLMIHVPFLIILLLFFLFSGIGVGLHSLQVVYYTFSAVILLLGVSWITSSLMVFIRDTSQAVGVAIQMGMWVTPIFWDATIVPAKYSLLYQLNPAYYIIRGYRDCFIDHVWFWERVHTSLYFWFITGLLFFIGALTFNRLRPHFADVL